MARKNDTDSADGLTHLITEQDIHAYVDGQLSPARRRAVERFLSDRHMSARDAASHLRATLDLRAVRDRLYEDRTLRAEVERLLAKRARAPRQDEDEPAAAVRMTVSA